MTTVSVSIGNATVPADKLVAYTRKAMDELEAEFKHKEDAKESAKDFKETVESFALLTKLPKGEVSKYFKARFEESQPQEDDSKPVGTEVVISRGELYTVLNSALEG